MMHGQKNIKSSCNMFTARYELKL